MEHNNKHDHTQKSILEGGEKVEIEMENRDRLGRTQKSILKDRERMEIEHKNKLTPKQKSILAGVGATLLVGLVSLIFSSDKAKKKTKSMVNRHRAKCYVQDRFGGHKKAKKVVSKLSDEEVDTLLGTADKVKNLEGQLSDMTSEAKDFMQDKTKESKKALKKLKNKSE